MTDADDKIARRYRELAREAPSSALDQAILAKAGERDPVHAGGIRSRFSALRWAGPVSIAAVLVLGIGVSLRMQLERPGIETSVPANEPAAPASEYSLPPSAESAPEPAAAADAAKPAQVSKPAAQNRQDAARAPKPFADDSFREPPRTEPAPPQAIPAAPPAAAFSPSPPPARESGQRAASAQPPAAVRAEEAPAAAQSAPLRKSVAPETRTDRELGRIARLREAGNHAEADAALTEFRRRYPEHRIPEAMWERVKPR